MDVMQFFLLISDESSLQDHSEKHNGMEISHVLTAIAVPSTGMANTGFISRDTFATAPITHSITHSMTRQGQSFTIPHITVKMVFSHLAVLHILLVGTPVRETSKKIGLQYRVSY